MSRPHLHPTTHVYYYRRVVPDDLRAIVGKREEKRSLGTKDPAEARTRHSLVAAEIEAKWRGLRQGVQTVSNRQAHAIAGEFYRGLVAQFEDEPRSPGEHGASALWNGTIGTEGLAAFSLLRSAAEQRMLAAIGTDNDAGIHDFLQARGMLVDREGFDRIRKAVAAALSQGHTTLSRFAEGDYRPDPDADRFPAPQAIKPSGKKEVLTAKALFDAYQAETKVSPATEKRWRGIFSALVLFVGRDDMRSISDDDVLSWKRVLLEGGATNKTVRNGHLAALKAVFNFAVREKLVLSNPAATVTVKSVKKIRTRGKGFTETEALTILRATLQPSPPRLTPEHAAARRWVPWICAYSGARVNEVTQLRASDIQLAHSGGSDIHFMRITPEAGSVKSGEFRDVSLHPHLIEVGFLDYVASRKGRHLFYEPDRHRGGSLGNPQSKKVGERLAAWVRQIGIKDPDVQPNHGWRHRFNSVCRDVGIDPEIRDIIVGHVPRTVGEAYGDLWHHVMAREIARLPRYNLE